MKSDASGAFSAVLPTGSYAVGLLVEDTLAGLRPAQSQTRAFLTQGSHVEVPVELVPLAASLEPAKILLGLAGGVLSGLPLTTPADLLVSIQDARGVLAPLSGTVTFAESDTDLLKVPADLSFAGQSQLTLKAGVQALVAAGSATLRAHVRERPSISGALTVQIAPQGVLSGPAASLKLSLPALVPAAKLPTGPLAKALDLQVTALDTAGQVASGYSGSVTFSDSDVLSLLVPPDYTFRPLDAGNHLFVEAVRGLGLPGAVVVLRAHDRGNPTIKGQLSVTLGLP